MPFTRSFVAIAVPSSVGIEQDRLRRGDVERRAAIRLEPPLHGDLAGVDVVAVGTRETSGDHANFDVGRGVVVLQDHADLLGVGGTVDVVDEEPDGAGPEGVGVQHSGGREGLWVVAEEQRSGVGGGGR